MKPTEDQFFQCKTITHIDDSGRITFNNIVVVKCEISDQFRWEFDTMECFGGKCRKTIDSRSLECWCESCHGDIDDIDLSDLLEIYLRGYDLEDLYNDKFVTIKSITGDKIRTEVERKEDKLKEIAVMIASKERTISCCEKQIKEARDEIETLVKERESLVE